MACRHEHHDDDHVCDHSEDGPDRGMEFSLYQRIDLARVRCLNERVTDSIRTVFKSYENRLDTNQFVESDADDQLIIYIPFTGSVKLKAIALYALGETAPREMRAWINREDIDFGSVESMEPLQTWDCIVDPPGGEIAEYPTKLTHFRAVRSLTLFITGSFSEEEITRLYYIGLKGEFTELSEDPIITLYELNANPADHPVHQEELLGMNRSIQ